MGRPCQNTDFVYVCKANCARLTNILLIYPSHDLVCMLGFAEFQPTSQQCGRHARRARHVLNPPQVRTRAHITRLCARAPSQPQLSHTHTCTH